MISNTYQLIPLSSASEKIQTVGSSAHFVPSAKHTSHVAIGARLLCSAYANLIATVCLSNAREDTSLKQIRMGDVQHSYINQIEKLNKTLQNIDGKATQLVHTLLRRRHSFAGRRKRRNFPSCCILGPHSKHHRECGCKGYHCVSRT